MKLFVATLALGAATTFVALFGPKDLIDKHALKLKEANSLVATFTVQQLPGSPETYTLTYSKPNMLSIDGPKKMIESDGKTIWEYNKADKTYTESPISDKTFLSKATDSNVWVWAAFFTPETLKNLDQLTTGSTRTVKGNQVTEVLFTVAKPYPWKGTIFIDNKLGIARGISFNDGSKETLIMASELKPSADTLPMSQFAFNPPADARKVEVTVPTNDSTGEVSYANVEPILRNNCTNCHNTNNPKGRFSVSSYQEVMASGAVQPGNPDGSSLVGYIDGSRRPRMPKGGAPLSDGDIATIRAWIKSGAKQ